MKRILLVFLAFIMLLSLCACGNDDTQTTEPSTTPSQTTTNSTQQTADNTEGTTEATQASTDELTTAPTDEPTTPPTQTPTGAPTTSPTEAPTAPPTTQPSTCSHSWKDATCSAPKTCSKCGATEGNAAGHSWKDATCTAPNICSTCGATGGNSYGHLWERATCTTPKTCVECGVTEGSALGHSFTTEFKLGEYIHKKCTMWDCNYSEHIELSPIEISFTNAGYGGYSQHAHCVDYPKFDIYVTGGYGDIHYFECYRENGEKAYCSVSINGNSISVKLFGYWYVDEEITIVVSDNYSHSVTRKITYVVDPTNEHKLVFKELS